MDAILSIKVNCILGEGPVWNPERNSLFWVDIEDKKIYEYNSETKHLHSWQLQKRVSLITSIQHETDLLIALEDGIARFNIATGSIDYLLHIEKELTDNRSNDGACDAKGRLWLGTMQLNCDEGCGSLYCINERLTLQKKINNTTISNGLVWNPENDRMYYIDSVTCKVQSYFFNMETANIQFEKTAIAIPVNLGMPDGMATDEDGMLWVAQWGGFSVNRWNPLTGEMLGSVYVPAPNVTSCVFGGENFDELFITTARQGMSTEDLEKYPYSGSIFMVKPGVKGLPAVGFRMDDCVL